MAKEFNVSAVFSVKDQFTSSIKKIKEATQGAKSAMNEASNSTNKFKTAMGNVRNSVSNATNSLKNLVTGGFNKVKTGVKNASDSISKFNATLKGNVISNEIGNLQKLAMAYLGVKSASSLFKTAIGSATEFQNYRNTLNVVMKDTNAAAETFKQYTDYANKTPWTEGEVVNAGVKLKSYGLEGTLEQIQKISDMSAVMNKSLDQGVEAIADAETGELERLKEFGITKQQIVDMAKSMGKDVVNNKGQITDQSAFNDAMFAVMEQKFSGGTDNMAKTFTGRMSTIKGTFQKTMASIIGVADDGTVKTGSAFDVISNRLEDVISVMQNFASNGGAEKVGEIVSNAFNKASEAIDYCKTHMNEIKTIAKGVLTGFIAFKSISGAFSVFDGISSVISRYNNLKQVLTDTGFIDKVKNGYGKFNGASSSILKMLNPINIVKNSFKGLSNIIMSTPRAFKSLVSSITSIPGMLKSLGSSGLSGIRTLFTGITTLVKHPISSFKLLLSAGRGAFTAIKTAIMGVMSPASIVIAIIAVIVAVVVHLWNTNEQFRNVVMNAWKRIQDAVSVAVQAIQQIMTQLQAFIQAHQAQWNAFKTALGAIWETICSVIGAAVITIIDVITGIVTEFANIIQLIADLCSGNWSAVWEDFKNIIKTAIDTVKGWWNDLVGFFTNNPIVAKVKKVFSGGDESHGEPDPDISDESTDVDANASGNDNFPGGLTTLHENGYEVYDLPKGTRIFNHDASVDLVNKMAANGGNRGTSISIAKLADSIVVREEADIDKIATSLARKLKIEAMKKGDN